MEPKFSVMAHVAGPPAEVYEAVANPDYLSRYFTTGGARGRIEAGATVTWDFHDFPGAFPVEVIEADPGKRIVLRWDANDEGAAEAYKTIVTIAFEPVDGGLRTHVSIAEQGWPATETGLKASYGNCMGWSQMLCALKAWIEHDINLRDGMYV